MGVLLARSFLFFAAGYLAAFLLAVLLFHVGRRQAVAADTRFVDELYLAATMLFVMGAPPAGAFAIVTSPWPAWGNARPIPVAWLSAAAGFVTYGAQLTGAVDALMFLPLPPGPLWLAAALRVLLPGIAAGLVALAIVSLSLRAPARV